MSLAQFSPIALVGGLLALAGGLYALQRLRVRHSRVQVVTTMFWKQVAQDTYARELTQRFRHLWAYLLLLLLSSLLWFVVGGLRSDSLPESERLLILDRSASASVGDHWPAWKRLLREQFLAGDPDATTVLVCGAAPRSLTVPGDSVVFLDERLATLEPEQSAPSVEHAMLALLRTKNDMRPLDVVIIGQAPLSQRVVDLLPEEVRLFRAGLPNAVPSAALLGMGVSPAVSGAWERVDLGVRVRGGEAPVLHLAGAEIPASKQQAQGLYLFQDLPAGGQQFEIQLPSAPAPFDRVQGQLPLRRPLSVLLDPALEPIFGGVLAAHPGVQLVEQGGDLVIRLASSDLGLELPALELISSDQQAEAIFLGDPAAAAEPGDLALRKVLGELALDQLDGTGLATSLGRPLEVTYNQASLRRVGIWEDLFSIEGAALQSSRSFPVFVGRVLSWLADTPDWVHTWQAGVPVPGLDWIADSEQTLAGSGEDLAPPLAGSISTALGSRSVGVFAPQGMSPAQLPAPLDGPSGDWNLGTWILLLALGLLLLEGRLVRLGRMP